MGKTQTPLTINVTDPAILEWPEIKALQEQQHTVEFACDGNVRDADLVLGPNCYYMTDEMRKYLPLAVKTAQRRKKGMK